MQLPAFGVYAELISGALFLGIDESSLAEVVGPEFWPAQQPGGTVHLETVLRLWRELVELTGDASLGLRLGRFPFFRLSGASAVALVSEDVPTALCRFARHWQAAFPESVWRLETGADAWLLEYQPVFVAPEALFDVQFRMAGALTLMRTLTTEACVPRLVSFTFEEPADVAEWYQVFRSPLRFRGERNIMEFDTQWFTRPKVGSDPWLAAALLEPAKSNGNGGARQENVANLVRHRLRERLPEGDVGIKAIAPSLNISVSTLQRRLHAEGTSYRDILEEVRRNVSLTLVRRADLTTGDMARELGYANTANFLRAFRRWFGQTPGRMRRTMPLD